MTDQLASELRDEGAKGDIFETDFELPAVQDDADSGSEVVAIESSDTDLENSDFDLALDESDAPAADESESQVVLLDDESGGTGRRTAATAGVGAAAVAATRGRGRSRPMMMTKMIRRVPPSAASARGTRTRKKSPFAPEPRPSGGRCRPPC